LLLLLSRRTWSKLALLWLVALKRHNCKKNYLQLIVFIYVYFTYLRADGQTFFAWGVFVTLNSWLITTTPNTDYRLLLRQSATL
jgi:hypothetical protein